MLLSLYSVIVDMEIKRRACNYGENIHSVVVIVLTQLNVNLSLFLQFAFGSSCKVYKVLQF